MKRICLPVVIILCAALLGGCGFVERMQAWKNGEDLAEPPQQEDMIQPLPQQGAEAEEQQPGDAQTEMREIVLYFADESNSHLEQEKRSIPKTEGIARATIGELIFGPQSQGLMPTIPAATILEDINIRDGICTVDFSSELVDNHPGGAGNEELTVYSIVNTLTQFPGVEQVRILVDGKEIASIAGHVDVSEAMARNDEIIK